MGFGKNEKHKQSEEGRSLFPAWRNEERCSFAAPEVKLCLCLRGKFGQVFKLKHKETGRVCAGKFYKGRRAKEREAARKEIELMNHLHHPKLVQCLAAYDQPPEMVMVMEL